MNKIKYRKQKYPSCQLISAINARIFLGLPDITNKLFEELVDLVLCRYGGAINIKKSYPFLGIKDKVGRYNYKWISKNLPIEIGYYDKKLGFHSSLIVSAKKKIFTLINSPIRRISFNELRKRLPLARHNWVIKGFKKLKSK